MKKVVVNKNFNEKYLYRYIDNFVNKEDIYWGGTELYIDNLEDLELTTDQQYIFICNETFFSVIESINTQNEKNSTHLVSKLLLDQQNADIVMDYLLTNGYITQSIRDNAKYYRIDTNTSHYTLSSSVVGNIVTFSNNAPRELLDYVSGNTDTLFLTMIGESSNQFTDNPYYTLTLLSSGLRYYTDYYGRCMAPTFLNNSGTIVGKCSYMAFELLSELKYDYQDKITHLDSVKFSIELPKEIQMQLQL